MPMQRCDDGWFEMHGRRRRPGTRYSFRIDGEIEVPDPASRFQPDDVHGPSEVIDPAYRLAAPRLEGPALARMRVPRAACRHLHAATAPFAASSTSSTISPTTGFTAIELMPVADFPGRWNWGYDGVLLFAPDSAYGRPDDLKALIDAAHQRGLMVFLDVVYNHFGPEGNYLGRYAPQFFTPAADALGQRDRLPASRGARASRSRTRCTGSTTIASTGCGSTPCTPSPSPGARRFSRS